jgi:hypothetical protein
VGYIAQDVATRVAHEVHPDVAHATITAITPTFQALYAGRWERL